MGDQKRGTTREPRGQKQRTRAAAEARRIYGDLFTPEERDTLDGALLAGDLTQEVALLRVLVRRAVEAETDLETVSRAIARLAQLLKIQHVLTGDAAKGLDEALAKVLAEIGTEIGL
jgi:hypothetical protein